MRIGMHDGKPSGASGANAQPVKKMEDSLTRSLKKQIARLQENLQKLSENSDLSMEEKMKRRQELMRQIADLNNQLRMHEMELRRERQNSEKVQEEQASAKKQGNGNGKAAGGKKDQGTGLSQANMQAMISADTTLDQAKVQGKVVRQIEGRKRVLAAEISQDAKRNTNTEAKQQELSELEQAGQDAEEKKAELLGKAGRVQQEAKDEEEGKKEEGEKTEQEKEEEKRQLRSVDVRI